jgi:hypothetical protein
MLSFRCCSAHGFFTGTPIFRNPHKKSSAERSDDLGDNFLLFVSITGDRPVGKQLLECLHSMHRMHCVPVSVTGDADLLIDFSIL